MLKVNAVYPKKYQNVLNVVKPGLTGVGSIIFRDEETILSEAKDFDLCYKKEIIPYKVELETWYRDNRSLLTDLKLMIITAWVILKPRSKLIYSVFPTIPYKDKATFGQIISE